MPCPYFLAIFTVSFLIQFGLMHKGFDPRFLIGMFQPIVYHGEHGDMIMLLLYLLVDSSA